MKKQQPDYSVKTIQVKLDVPSDDRDILRETFLQFNEAVSRVIDAGWNEGDRKDYSKQSLHKKTYSVVKDDLDLTANLVIQARSRAADQIKRCVQNWSNDKKASKPQPRPFASVAYDKRTVTIKERKCTISTIDGRKAYSYILGDFQKKHLDDPNYEWRSATLNYKQSTEEFYLHVTIRKPIQYKKGYRVLGVDLGINNLAVTSTAQFYSGDNFSWHKDGYFRTRRSLQRKGTRSARRTLKQLSERENRYSRDYLHCVAKGVVDEALKYDCAFIALEELTTIRDRVPSWFPRNVRKLHQWAFQELRRYITYKAREYGIRILTVDPAYTSQKCSRCGNIDNSNRSGAKFRCTSCGYSLQADYNASKTIGLRAISLPEGKRPSELGHGQLALKSGSLTPSSAKAYRSYDQAA